jgi:hypothetical protein
MARLSLTKKQLDTPAGVELLCILEDVTEDGIISNEEVAHLRSWLERNKEVGFPGAEFLFTRLEAILADGVIEPTERAELQANVEKVLPPAARDAAMRRRMAAAAAVPRKCATENCPNLLPAAAPKGRKWCDSCREVRSAPNVFRDGDLAGFSLGFKVAGVSYENRQEVIRRYLQSSDPLFLIRDPRNRHDRNAVEVRLENGMSIGYVPRADVGGKYDRNGPHSNADLARLLDAGARYEARCWNVYGSDVLGVFVVGNVDCYLKPNPARAQIARERGDEDGTAPSPPFDPAARPAIPPDAPPLRTPGLVVEVNESGSINVREGMIVSSEEVRAVVTQGPDPDADTRAGRTLALWLLAGLVAALTAVVLASS